MWRRGLFLLLGVLLLHGGEAAKGSKDVKISNEKSSSTDSKDSPKGSKDSKDSKDSSGLEPIEHGWDEFLGQGFPEPNTAAIKSCLDSHVPGFNLWLGTQAVSSDLNHALLPLCVPTGDRQDPNHYYGLVWVSPPQDSGEEAPYGSFWPGTTNAKWATHRFTGTLNLGCDCQADLSNMCSAASALPAPPNAVVPTGVASFAYGAAMTLTCAAGTNPQGNMNIMCRGDDTWSIFLGACTESPTCTKPDLSALHMSTDCAQVVKTGDTCVASCVSPYPARSGSITCLLGTFGTPDLACEAPRCSAEPHTAVSGNFVEGTCKAGATHNTHCNLGCPSDREPSGTLELQCIMGTWTLADSRDRCTLKECDRADFLIARGFEVDGGNRCGAKGTLSGTVCDPKCRDRDFYVEEESMQPLLECKDGHWKLQAFNEDHCKRRCTAIDDHLQGRPGWQTVSGQCEGKTCTLACDSNAGYTAKQITISCRDGNWAPFNDECIEKSCPATKPRVEGGEVICTSDKLCHYECADDTYAVGALQVRCVKGEWTFPDSSGACVPRQCTSLPPVAAEYDTSDCDLPTSTYCSLGCAGDAEPSPGANTRVFCTNGEWSQPTFTCDASCPGPPSDLAAHIITTGCTKRGDGDSCSLKCEPGFSVYPSNAQKFVTCNKGIWTDEQFTCKPDCTALPVAVGHALSGIVLEGSCSLPKLPGDTCRVKCKDGLSPTSSQKIECLGGAWSDVPFTCTGNSCRALSRDLQQNSHLSDAGCDTKHNAWCLATCEVGYDGPVNDRVFHCVNGEWQGNFNAKCTEKSCGPPPLLWLGEYTTTCQGPVYAHGAGCDLECKYGFTPNPRASSISCSKGFWSMPTFECEQDCVLHASSFGGRTHRTEGDCPTATNNKNALAHLETCSLDCEAGYKPDKGRGKAQCVDGVIVTAGGLVCVEESCPGLPPSPPFSKSSCRANTPGTICSRWCEDGFLTNFEAAQQTTLPSLDAVCSKGAWIGVDFTCIALPCGALPPGVSDTHNLAWTKGTCPNAPVPSGTKCSLGCRSNAVARGNGNVECQAGAWTVDSQFECMSHCKVTQRHVRAESGVVANTCVVGQLMRHGDFCNLACDDGFVAQGSSRITCNKGAFDKMNFFCTEAPCNAMPPASNDVTAGTCADLTYPVQSRTACMFGCRAGSEPAIPRTNDKGSGRLAVCTKGKWNTPAFSCISKSCGQHPRIGFGHVIAGVGPTKCPSSQDSGKRCTLACDRDYTMENPAFFSVDCFNGKWTIPNMKCMAPCELPGSTKSVPGLLPGSCAGTVAHGQTCEVSCSTGFNAGKANGRQISLTCKDGSFEGLDVVSCEAAPCQGMPTLPAGGEPGSCTQTQSEHGSGCTATCKSHLQPDSVSKTVFNCLFGQWSKAEYRCIARTCADQPSVLGEGFAKPSCQSRNAGSRCSLSCRQGHTRVGADTDVVCQDSGDWSCPQFTCHRECGPHPALALQDRAYAVAPAAAAECRRSSAAHDTVCAFACAAGFDPFPANAIRTTVCADADWTPLAFQCHESCKALAVDANLGFTSSCGGASHGSTCAMRCLPGWDANGDGSMTCRDGQWHKNGQFSCTESPCGGQPPLPDRQEHLERGACNKALFSQQSCQLACAEGYYPSVSPALQCVRGAWKFPAGLVCLARPCATFPLEVGLDAVRADCKLPIAHGKECKLACLDGYTATAKVQATAASLSAVCDRGYWLPIPATCVGNQCSVHPAIGKDHVTAGSCASTGNTDTDTTCALGCELGYAPAPSTSMALSCERGQWTPFQGACVDLTPPTVECVVSGGRMKATDKIQVDVDTKISLSFSARVRFFNSPISIAISPPVPFTIDQPPNKDFDTLVITPQNLLAGLTTYTITLNERFTQLPEGTVAVMVEPCVFTTDVSRPQLVTRSSQSSVGEDDHASIDLAGGLPLRVATRSRVQDVSSVPIRVAQDCPTASSCDDCTERGCRWVPQLAGTARCRDTCKPLLRCYGSGKGLLPCWQAEDKIPPSAVRRLTVLRITPASLTVAWVAPEFDFEDGDVYQVEHREPSADVWTIAEWPPSEAETGTASFGRETRLKLNQLQRATRYQIRVTAYRDGMTGAAQAGEAVLLTATTGGKA